MPPALAATASFVSREAEAQRDQAVRCGVHSKEHAGTRGWAGSLAPVRRVSLVLVRDFFMMQEPRLILKRSGLGVFQDPFFQDESPPIPRSHRMTDDDTEEEQASRKSKPKLS